MNKIKLFPIRLEHLWFLTVIIGIFIFVNTHPIRPNDFWWHVKVGKEILETQSIPKFDNFSFTMNGEPYPSYQMFWLMEVFMYAVFKLGGPALNVFMQSFIITTTYAIITYIGYQMSGSWRLAAFGGIYAGALGINDWNVRPQSITFLLGSLCLLSIFSYRQKSDWRYLLALPICMLIWVNSHGTFPIGLTMIGIWFIDELWKYSSSKEDEKRNEKSFVSSSLALIISSLVIFVNPRGIEIIDYLKTMGSNTVVQNLVVEWAPPAINSLQGGLFYAELVLLAVVMAISPGKPSVFEILTLIIFAILAINTSRGVIWFGLVGAPIFARHLHLINKRIGFKTSVDNAQGSLVLNYSIGGLLFLLAFITLPWFKEKLPLPPAKAGLVSSETPIEATEFLIQEEMPVEIFHAMSFGSYMIWAAQPTYKVFVDSRIELYPPEIWRDYLSISNAEDDWEQMLREFRVNTLLLSPEEQAPLIIKLRESGQWVSVYKDDAAEIFTRIGEGSARNPVIFQDIKNQ